MSNRTKNYYPCFLYPQTIDILAKIIDNGISFEELIDYFEIPEDQADTIKKVIYSEKPCERTGECIPSCSYYDPYCGCILGKRAR